VAAKQTRRERRTPATQKANRALTYFISPFVKRPHMVVRPLVHWLLDYPKAAEAVRTEVKATRVLLEKKRYEP
jgi:hypothetical protein